MKTSIKALALIALIAAIAPSLFAQWPAHPTRGVPRKSTGEPDLAAFGKYSPMDGSCPARTRNRGGMDTPLENGKAALLLWRRAASLMADGSMSEAAR